MPRHCEERGDEAIPLRTIHVRHEIATPPAAARDDVLMD
jgi:hypothetical protein